MQEICTANPCHLYVNAFLQQIIQKEVWLMPARLIIYPLFFYPERFSDRISACQNGNAEKAGDRFFPDRSYRVRFGACRLLVYSNVCRRSYREAVLA